jgi:hypothetical protein
VHTTYEESDSASQATSHLTLNNGLQTDEAVKYETVKTPQCRSICVELWLRRIKLARRKL